MHPFATNYYLRIGGWLVDLMAFQSHKFAHESWPCEPWTTHPLMKSRHRLRTTRYDENSVLNVVPMWVNFLSTRRSETDCVLWLWVPPSSTSTSAVWFFRTKFRWTTWFCIYQVLCNAVAFLVWFALQLPIMDLPGQECRFGCNFSAGSCATLSRGSWNGIRMVTENQEEAQPQRQSLVHKEKVGNDGFSKVKFAGRQTSVSRFSDFHYQ